jgi:hypothetical protein
MKTRAQQIEEAASVLAAAMIELNQNLASPFTDKEKLLQRVLDDALKQTVAAFNLPADPKPLRYRLIEEAAQEFVATFGAAFQGDGEISGADLVDSVAAWLPKMRDALTLGEHDACADMPAEPADAPDGVLGLSDDPVHPLIVERPTDDELEALKRQGSVGPIMLVREPGLYLDGKPIEPEARDAILAALRLWQSVKDDIGDELMEIHTNGGEHAGMDSESIDAFCEEINR